MRAGRRGQLVGLFKFSIMVKGVVRQGLGTAGARGDPVLRSYQAAYETLVCALQRMLSGLICLQVSQVSLGAD